ncbi:uncharacterized protein KQ657_004623 [Scheffersomyces spartinae]|uniref:Uncharacterized protein n=1 Tax=Scheffersomyces spartinae TaxID=45513 RepID=A0A9P7VB05_9ASCO|nr:uncharacterized protein KQ657_004623 [Scheffersomyces spartinae]KAG7194410.1 hypothetical protein KQ657_004623 [Scheffersomyces spartinae]
MKSEIDNEHDDTVIKSNPFSVMSSPTPSGEHLQMLHLLGGDNDTIGEQTDKVGTDQKHKEEDEEDGEKDLDYDDAVDAADRSFLNSSDVDEIPIKEDISSIPPPPPIFINKRKRNLTESPPAADSTGIQTNMTITPDNQQLFRKLALESHKLPSEPVSDRRNNTLTDLNISASSINSSTFKISFNDSTPCPSSPRRKRMRLNSGSATKIHVKGPILDFSNCRKSSVLYANIELQKQSQEQQQQISDISSDQDYSQNESMMQRSPISTPISQSTPDNSNPPTDKRNSTQSTTKQQSHFKPPEQMVEYGQPINGYRFITPINNQRFFANPTTPLVYSTHSRGGEMVSNLSLYFNELLQLGDQRIAIDPDSTQMNSSINDTNDHSQLINDYESNEHDNLNPRRNDPYLSSSIITKNKKKGVEVRQEYDQLFRLPLLQLFNAGDYNKHFPLKEQICTWINDGESLVNFYNYVKYPEETIFELIKIDRIRWHPDKWPDSKLNQHQLDMKIVSLLSQTLNSIIDDLI